MGTIADMKKESEKDKPIRTKTVFRKKLETQTKYTKCPYCWHEKKLQHWTYEKLMTLPNVTYRKEKETYLEKGKEIDVFEEYWDCDDCGKALTTEDYVRFYVSKNKWGEKYDKL